MVNNLCTISCVRSFIFPLFAWCFADFIGVLALPSAKAIEENIWDPTEKLLFVALLCFVATLCQHAFLETSSQLLVKNLRKQIFSSILHLPASFFDQKKLQQGE